MRRLFLSILLVAAAAAISGSASAHGPAATKAGIASVGPDSPKACRPVNRRAEARLRRMEKLLLGTRHAAEHARVRAQSRIFACRKRPKAPARRAHAVGDPSAVGRWTAPVGMNAVGIHSTLMPNGKVLFFYANPAFGDGPARAMVWNPATGTGHRVDPPSNIWCAGQTLLADGRVLVAGGNLAYEKPGEYTFKGLNQIWIFDPSDESWTRGPDMAHGRWYPTTTRLADGRVLITAGWDESGRMTPYPARNQDVEVYTPAADGRGPGTVKKVSERDMVFYPHWFVLPNGRALLASPRNYESAILSPSNWSWTDIPDAAVSREYGYGSGILLPGGPSGSYRVMLLGGSDARSVEGNSGSTASTEVFDASNPSAGWSQRAPLSEPRRNLNTVILPDGDLLAVGGNGSGASGAPRRETLLYRPATDTFTRMASQSEQRGYHSTALLLPDATVLSAGDDTASGGGWNTDAVEIFSPTYLFRTPRPAIASAPSAIKWGSAFTIATGADATRAVLVAPGSTTHGNDMNQRHVELAVTRAGAGLVATAPPSANVAPPGWYMLFALNAEGVPSVAHWVHVGPDADEEPVEAPEVPDEPPPLPSVASPPPAVSAAPVAATVSGSPAPAPTAPATVRVRSAGARVSPGALRLRVVLSADRPLVARLRLVPLRGRTLASGAQRRAVLGAPGARRLVIVRTRTPARWTTLRRRLRIEIHEAGRPVRTISRTVIVRRTAGTPSVTLR